MILQTLSGINILLERQWLQNLKETCLARNQQNKINNIKYRNKTIECNKQRDNNWRNNSTYIVFSKNEQNL